MISKLGIWGEHEFKHDGQKIQISSYKINKTRQYNVQHSD